MPAAVPVSIGCSVAFKRDAAGLELVHDVLEVLQRARQTVDAGDDEGVAGAQEVEQHLQFAAAVAAGAARRLGPDHLAAGRLERGALDRQVLVEGRDPGVAVAGHRGVNRLVSVWTLPSYRLAPRLSTQMRRVCRLAGLPRSGIPFRY